MGAWGNGIFDDDLASDIRGDFEDALEEGVSVNVATGRILQAYSEILEDDDEAHIVYLSLATLQLNHSSLQQEIKDKALEIIETGEGLERWAEAGEEALAERMKILKELKLKLSR